MDFLFQCLQRAVGFKQRTVQKLHAYLHPVKMIYTVQLDLIMRADFRNLRQHLFNLRREYIHAADNQHVVCTAGKILHTRRGTAAFTRLIKQSCNILCAVTDHRQRLLRQRRHNELALLTFRQHFSGLRIDDFRDEMVFIDMHAAKLQTLSRHTGTVDLTHAVILRRLEIRTPQAVHFLTHALGHALAAEQTDTHFQVFLRIQTHRADHFANM